MIPPKPEPRPDRVSLWRYWRLFRKDILSAQPARLYRAWMAEFRTPFFRSFLVNQPSLVRRILTDELQDFPKSKRATAGLVPLLGRSVFVTNGDDWKHQRRIIDPAFERGRVKSAFPSMLAAARAAADRLSPGIADMDAFSSRATADVIFRTLFSIPIEERIAAETFDAFRTFQRAQPVATPRALVPWLPAIHRPRTRRAARHLRRLIGTLVAERAGLIADGTAPDDLATRLMTTPDPETGRAFTPSEMEDQVAIFFLAGHETSAALLGWALWCLAAAPEWQAKVADEARAFRESPDFATLALLTATRNVVRETLRLYPPVPMMVREAARDMRFRDRDVPAGAQIVLSPWHLQRHERLWSTPDRFDPGRWAGGTDSAATKSAYIPFSAGPRVCPGAGFAMTEATLFLAVLLARFTFEIVDRPVPVAHLTVRARDGIRLRIGPRSSDRSGSGTSRERTRA